MQPPWLEFPSIDRGAIGWRMGAGEGYYNAFHRWFSTLTAAERADFEATHPEPRGWRGFYETISKNPWTD